MEQVKAALAWLKEHHFWVLSILVIGATLGVWYTASASVAKQTKAAMEKINGEFSSIGGLSGQTFKPNDNVNAGQDKETAKLAQDVLKEWDELYNEQKSKVLVWPKELPERFIQDVQNKKFGDEILSRNREFYLNYIKDTFPSLVEIVDATLLDESSSGGGAGAYGGGGGRGGFGGEFGGGRGASAETPLGPDGQPLESHLVEWLDQGDLRARLVPQTVPSSLQIWVLQEDLWVYRTLLEAIAAANKKSNATRRERAAVQTIISMKVGRLAAASDAKSRQLVPPDAEETASLAFGGGFGGEYGGGEGGFGGEFGGGRGGEGGFGGEFGGGGEYGGGGEFGAEGGEGADPATVLLAGRYIDETGAPVTTVAEGYNFGREFKRLPVAMVLEMDTKYLSTLLWELANAPLQVEVKDVRFNPEGDVGGGASGGVSSAIPTGGSSGEVAVFDRRPTVGTVVLRGIVYLFNPPDPSISSPDGAGEAAVE